ncbi:MAG: hypothetical protein L0Y71_09280 [Gemmataceae bacterium]|nr:hypothetical protein [Gemmataceae bacterium]
MCQAWKRPVGKRQAWMLFGMSALVALTLGCTDKAEPYLKAATAQRSAMEQVTAILAGVTDAESMEAAKEKLLECHDHCELIVHRSKNLPKPGPDILKRLDDEKDKMSAVVAKLQAEVKRVQALPQGAKFLQEVKIQK